MRGLYVRTMPRVRDVRVDMEDFDLLPTRRKTSGTVGASRERLLAEAYEFVLGRFDLEAPTIPSDKPFKGSHRFPEWAVERSIARLVKDGVLRGPVVLPKTKGGRPIWYSHNLSSSLVIWAEGAWRKTNIYYPVYTQHMIVSGANRPRSTAKRRNAEAARKYEFETRQTRSNSVFRGIYPARRRSMEVPAVSMSMRARVRQFFRNMEIVDWDGRGYVPVPGPALEAVLAWRSSLPVVKTVPPSEAKEMEEEKKTCRRCGVSFPISFWRNKRTHALKECNVFVATRIMAG